MIEFLGNCECLEKISVFPDMLMILMAPKHLSGEGSMRTSVQFCGNKWKPWNAVGSPALLSRGI